MDAIGDLIAKVEKLAVQVNRIVTLVDTPTEVTCRAKGSDRLEVVAGTDFAQDLQVGGTAEATNFPLSPHQDNGVCSVGANEVSDEINSSNEAAQFDRVDTRSRAKNAIAGRVLALHDRLGGFIKPLPPGPFDRDR